MDRVGDMPDDVGEDALLDRCRAGDRDAFDTLFRRHYATAVRFASHVNSSLDSEDVTAEAFARVWSALRGGGGPTGELGPYLRTTIRNVAINAATRGREETADDDHIDFWMRRESQVVDDGFSAAMAEHQLVADAFDTLPDRWRSVLWMVEVEGRRTADVAGRLGMTPNGTTALTKRARSALGQAWLQAHVNAHSSNPECEWVLKHIGRHTRRSLSAAQEERVRAHLAECDSCERASHRVAHLAVSLRIAATIGGGSAAAMAAALLGEPTPAAAAEHVAGAGGAGTPPGDPGAGGTAGPGGSGGDDAGRDAGGPGRLSRSAIAALVAAVVVFAGLAVVIIRTFTSSGGVADPQPSAVLSPSATAATPEPSDTSPQIGPTHSVPPGPTPSVPPRPTTTLSPSASPTAAGTTAASTTGATRTNRPGATTTPRATRTATARPTRTATSRPTQSATRTPTPTSRPTVTRTPTPTPNPSPTTSTPPATSPTPSPSPTAPTPTSTAPTPTPTPSPNPSEEPTHTPTPSASPSPTGTPVIGVNVTDSTDPARPGAVVTSVRAGSPAEAAGLLTGDIITAVGGQPVTTASELVAAIRAGQVGQPVRLSVLRGQEALLIDVVPESSG